MEVLLCILGGGLGTAVVTGLFSLIQWNLNRKAQKEDTAETRQLADCAERGKEIARVEKRVDALYKADRIQMYDRIKHLGKSYISKGEIHTDDLEDLIEMHRCYHDDLGGNGFLDSIMEQVHCLPIKTN